MSGGEPSSIKQKPSCAADLPILSPKCGKAAGCVYSNYLCAVLWGAERISIETTLSIEGDVPSLRLGQIPAGQKFLPMVETFSLYKSKIRTLSLRGFSAALRGYTLPVFMNLQSKFYLTRAATRYDKMGSIPTFLTN